jgi:hypothetical protein
MLSAIFGVTDSIAQKAGVKTLNTLKPTSFAPFRVSFSRLKIKIEEEAVGLLALGSGLMKMEKLLNVFILCYVMEACEDLLCIANASSYIAGMHSRIANFIHYVPHTPTDRTTAHIIPFSSVGIEWPTGTLQGWQTEKGQQGQ